MRTSHKAVGTVLASCALVVGISTSAMATTKVYADDLGYGEWSADPSGSTPGDALRACDTNADGYGVLARVLDINGHKIREATTSGHPAGYCTAWKTGDLGENVKYQLLVYAVKNGTESILNSAWVTS